MLFLIGLLTAAMGVLNIVLAVLPSPVGGFEDIVPTVVRQGSRFVLLLLGVTLIVTARSLTRGKRLGWFVAVAAVGLSAAAHTVKDVDLLGAATSSGLLGTLLLTQPLFPARSDPPTAARGFLVFLLGFAAAVLYGTLGLYFLDQEFREPISLSRALGDSLRLVFILPSASVQPVTSHGSWLIDSVRVFFLAVLLFSLSRVLNPVVHRATVGRTERERVGHILEKHGRSSISFFALLPDKSYFFSPSGDAVLAYKVIGSTAVVMGDPIGEPARFPDLGAAFLEQCDLDDWAFCFHQATPDYLEVYRNLGLRALKIGEEAVIDLEHFDLEGKEAKHLRNVLNRFTKEGFQARLLQPPLSDEVLHELRAVSDEWLAQRGRRERTFTVGRFEDSYIRHLPVMAVYDPTGAIIGFANIIPSYRLPEGNFDLMRYRRDAPRNTVDFLFLSLASHFKEAGHSGMNLGLAPFSGLGDDGAMPVVRQAMKLLYEYGSYLFRYKGLREFKAKFHPRWEPRYLIYRSDWQLPGLALAVARAGELRHGLRFPRQAAITEAHPAPA